MNSYTYTIENFRASTSWLDHVLSSEHEIVSNVCIRYGFAFGDHISLQFSLVLQFPCAVGKRALPSVYVSRQFIFWQKLYDVDLESYLNSIESVSTELWNESLSCSAHDCTSENNKKLLTNLYGSTVQAVLISSSHPPSAYYTNRRKVIPGWNECCKDLYLLNKFVAKFRSKDKVNFWYEMRKISGKQSFYNTSCINNKTDTREMIRLFYDKYSAVLNHPLSQVPILN